MPLALAVELAATLLVLAVELADVTFGLAVAFATMLSELRRRRQRAKVSRGCKPPDNFDPFRARFLV